MTVLKPLRSLQSSSLPSNNLCFALCNAHFIGNKVETVIDHAIGNDIGLCIFTETWLKDLDSVCIADLSRHGYFFKSFPWQKSIWWWCRHFIPQLFWCFTHGWERTWFFWIFGLDSEDYIHIVAVYCPPSSSISVFFDEFLSYLLLLLGILTFTWIWCIAMML